MQIAASREASLGVPAAYHTATVAGPHADLVKGSNPNSTFTKYLYDAYGRLLGTYTHAVKRLCQRPSNLKIHHGRHHRLLVW